MMKAPVLGLAIAATAFAGSSLYLWQQLDLERERSAQVADTARQLNARIAQLEQTRQQFMHVRASNGTTVSGAFGAGPAPAVPAARGAVDPTEPRSEAGWVAEMPRQRPAAVDKMMRWQIRADHKRQYADIGTALGLGKDQARQLIDLLADQQLAQFDTYANSGWSRDPAEARRKLEDAQRANAAAVEELLGPEKAQALQEYQRSLPARQEFQLLVDQLEGNDVTLTPEQHRKLLAVYLEERQRVPMPSFDAGQTPNPDAYHQAYTNWQNDYSERVSAEARNILDATQLTAFNEVQDWQREMRSQFQAVTFTSAPNTAVALPAGAVSFNVTGGAVATAAPATDAGETTRRTAPPRQP
jgi:hypothetical protein